MALSNVAPYIYEVYILIELIERELLLQTARVVGQENKNKNKNYIQLQFESIIQWSMCTQWQEMNV